MRFTWKPRKTNTESKLTSDTNIEGSKTDKLLYTVSIIWETWRIPAENWKEENKLNGKSRTETQNIVNWQQEVTYNWEASEVKHQKEIYRLEQGDSKWKNIEMNIKDTWVMMKGSKNKRIKLKQYLNKYWQNSPPPQITKTAKSARISKKSNYKENHP